MKAHNKARVGSSSKLHLDCGINNASFLPELPVLAPKQTANPSSCHPASCCQQGLAATPFTWPPPQPVQSYCISRRKQQMGNEIHFLPRPLKEMVPVQPSLIPGHPFSQSAATLWSVPTFACPTRNSTTSQLLITSRFWLNVTLAKALWLNDLTRATEYLSIYAHKS